MKDKDEMLPKWYEHFLEKYPGVAKKYIELGEEVHKWGPLDDKARALVKLAISGSTKHENAFRTHIRKADSLGVKREEIEHVALLSLPTIGFPSAMAMLSMIDDEYSKFGT